MSKSALTIFSIILIFAAGWFLHAYISKPTIIKQKIEMTNFEKNDLIQQARQGWMKKETVDSLLKFTDAQKAKFSLRDSLIITYKDSTFLNKKDTTIEHYTYVPFYEADTTFETSAQDSSGNKAIINQTLHQRFFPLQESFGSTNHINSVIFELKKKQKKWYQNIKGVIGGGLIGNGSMISAGFFIGAGYTFDIISDN